MKIWFISDTHCQHERLSIPDVDCVIHCGDEANDRDPAKNSVESLSFFDWYRKLDIKYKVFIPGNHSIAIERQLIIPSEYPEIIYLNHEMTEIDGVKIFGSPYTPGYGFSWAFMKKRGRMALVWENVPKVDILVTHGPPKGVLDMTMCRETKRLIQVGCKSLKNALEWIQPDVHAFGHIHSEQYCTNFGKLEQDRTYINCSCLINNDWKINQGVIHNVD